MEDTKDKMEDLETPKVSDSAYSNSCSKSRMSHSSKSSNSRSQSSGSSGYGGGHLSKSAWDTTNQPPEKRAKEKESKKKKQLNNQTVEDKIETEYQLTEQQNGEAEKQENENEECDYFARILSPEDNGSVDKGSESMDLSNSDGSSCNKEAGFSCVISMHDGVVMYTTSSLTLSLGFPKEMWIGRSLIDFIHPRDRDTFASQINNGVGKTSQVIGMHSHGKELLPTGGSVHSHSNMACRIRRYRNLGASGFNIQESVINYLPFLLKLTLKSITDDKKKTTYLIIQAKPFVSAFKEANELMPKTMPFVIRHAANGLLEYIDIESVPYLGYIPQDIINKDALQMYHSDDLSYMTQVYETIVKEGGMSRSKAHRLMAQNGDYLKVETEWTSYTNPWSKKLEFVTGKHHIIEGPKNPDVFHKPPEHLRRTKLSEEELIKAQDLRDSIVRNLNEVLTKPAEAAKQHMSSRCQHLTSFMESLMEDQPKLEEELRLEIQDPDHGYYERDTVMLGGISPHHEYSHSISSTGTPVSYTQLNYKETLQRYFESQEPFSLDVCNSVAGEHLLVTRENDCAIKPCSSPTAAYYVDSGDMPSDSSLPLSLPFRGNSSKRLTETLLSKHNQSMEKEMIKMYSEIKSNEKKENSSEKRQKRKEHLARCNAAYQPTVTPSCEPRAQGVKRLSNSEEGEHKHHCPSPPRRRPCTTATTTLTSGANFTTTALGASATASNNATGTVNAFFMGITVPQPIPIISPTGPLSGVFPIYASAATPMAYNGMNNAPVVSGMPNAPVINGMPNAPVINGQFPVPCMVYGQAIYGSPFIYPVNAGVPYAMQQEIASKNVLPNSGNPLALACSNYEEACKQGLRQPATEKQSPDDWKKTERRIETKVTYTKTTLGHSSQLKLTNAMNRDSGADSSHIQNNNSELFCSGMEPPGSGLCPNSTEAVPESQLYRGVYQKSAECTRNSDEPSERTDGESSYSSFYSSFFKTDSCSATDSGDGSKKVTFKLPTDTAVPNTENRPTEKKFARRKKEPPWLEHVNLTSELIKKYKVLTKSVEDALDADKQEMEKLKQSNMVNEQLHQLYQELQLEGVAGRLSLEESLESSSSSGEESNPATSSTTPKVRRKREYSKLVMIYEEDAPLPPVPKLGVLLAPAEETFSEASPHQDEESSL